MAFSNFFCFEFGIPGDGQLPPHKGVDFEDTAVEHVRSLCFTFSYCET